MFTIVVFTWLVYIPYFPYVTFAMLYPLPLNVTLEAVIFIHEAITPEGTMFAVCV